MTSVFKVSFERQVQTLICNDPVRWPLLALVRDLGVPDAWIGAGFVRNAVWDHLHGRAMTALQGDVDVLWFDPARSDPAEDLRLRSTPGKAEVMAARAREKGWLQRWPKLRSLG